ncbi:hypothetical protein SprV_0200680900 [Sparganum proliferum]
MPMDAYCDERTGVRIAYRADGQLLNSRRMQSLNNLSRTTVYDLLFSDDCSLDTTTEADMQRSLNFHASGCTNFGLTINSDEDFLLCLS